MINKTGLKSLLSLLKNSQFYFARVKFPLPDLGQKIKQGSVKKLYVKEGDKVQQFQKIADVESDKQFTQITAPEVGVIAKIYYKQAQVCKVGDLFMQIETDGTGESSTTTSHKQIQKKEQNASIASQSQSHSQSHSSNSQIIASPVVRMFAQSKNIQLNKVKGTGKKGRVLKQDIINFIQNKGQEKPKSQSKVQSQTTQQGKSYETKKISMNPFQKGMQKSMTEANKVPHLYYNEVMDITELDSMRQKLKSSGLKVTVMGIITKTFSLALADNPKMNSSYRTDKNQFEYTIHDSHNISLAIDTANGLVVPNIKNVQNLSIVQIQEKLSELKKLADSAKLTREHLEGGTICLSNIGTIAGVSACPLVLVPQTCIVAIGKVVETPYFVGTSVLKKKFITMSFGCDHRVIDGGSVARFSNSWKSILENPYLALAKMR